MNNAIFFSVWVGTIFVTTLMFIFWLIQQRLKNAGVIDIGWTFCLVSLTLIYSLQAPGYWPRRLMILSLVTAWGIRLSSLLIKRIFKDQKEDRRYQRLREEWKTRIDLKFLFLFECQAMLALVLSTPFLIICLNPGSKIAFIEIGGVLIWMVGLLGETLSDEQLQAFKSDPNNKGKTCRRGLWNYSRHPNYFFEWLLWVGYFVFALGSPGGWLGIIAPILMLHFLINVTGIPFAEAQALRTRGEEYRQYQRTTSFFVPLPKRSGY